MSLQPLSEGLHFPTLLPDENEIDFMPLFPQLLECIKYLLLPLAGLDRRNP
jgi:hypothetical protein